jgi:hypothetical protein
VFPPTTLVGDGISVKMGDYMEELEKMALIVTDKQIA